MTNVTVNQFIELNIERHCGNGKDHHIAHPLCYLLIDKL